MTKVDVVMTVGVVRCGPSLTLTPSLAMDRVAEYSVFQILYLLKKR